MLQDTPSKTPHDNTLSHDTPTDTSASQSTSTDATAAALDSPAVTDAASTAPITPQPAPTAANVEPLQLTAGMTAAMSKDKPATASSDERAAGLPALRKDRWWAAVIDMVLQMLASLPFIWYMGLDAFKNPTPALALANSANAILVYLVLHGYLLHKYGQTIGKAEYGMRIEMLNGDKASLQHIMLWRYLPIMVLSFVPVIGQLVIGLVNPLLIFRQDRRCLHDHIARTQVRYCYREQPADTATATQTGDSDAPDTPVAATTKPVPDQLQ